MEEPRKTFTDISSWYRLETCTLKKIRPRPSTARDRLLNDVDLTSGVWALVFDGSAEEYRPEAVVLDQALSLPLSDEEDRPDETCLQFFRRWGPLGLSSIAAKISPEVTDKQRWQLFHKPGRSYPERRYISDEEELSGGYIEYWPLINRQLMKLYWAVTTPAYGEIQDLCNTYVDIKLNYDEHNKPGFLRSFHSLFGALVGLAVERTFKGEHSAFCPPPCAKHFSTADNTQKFCGSPCRDRYHKAKADDKRRSDPIEREKRRLRSRLNRREPVIVDHPTANKIRSEIKEAKTDIELKAIEKKYGLAVDLPKGPPPTFIKEVPK